MRLRYKGRIRRIQRLQKEYEILTDRELQDKTRRFKKRLANGETTNQILEEAYAVVCEADRRVLGMLPFAEQIMGAIAIHGCHLAEMATGEGKTLMATMPLYLHALTGKSTILVTANEYLAIRDAKEMGPVYEFLGLTVRAGVKEDPSEQVTNDEKREFYAADILYTTHAVLGFDYLFENLVKKAEDRFMREFYFVMIDEADAVLLDAAQMPLVISGAPRVQSNLYQTADFFASILQEDRDYKIENRAIWLTEEGIKYAEDFFGIENFYSKEYFEINRHVTLALRARYLFGLQKDYLISEDGEIVLLDRGTGRGLPGMKLRGGQHQAIETKEGLKITQEQRSVASITYQNLFLMFPKMAGMSGTLEDAGLELFQVYKKTVVPIPTHKPCRRVDYKDQYYQNGVKQFEAVIQEAVSRHRKEQPVLIVTSTIQDTKIISQLLLEKEIPHCVLNANNVFWEADIIKEAGKRSAVTVSTGLAGRGTDIKLEEGVADLGGLAVLGVGRMENTRLERQVRGRSGRQGDPGCSKFFCSLEDEVVKTMGENYIEKFLTSENRLAERRLKNLINKGQKIHMDQSIQQRERAMEYDRILKRQRTILYAARNRLLDHGRVEDDFIKKVWKWNIRQYVKEKKQVDEAELSRYVLDHISYELGYGFSPKVAFRGRKLRNYLQKYAEVVYENKMSDFENEDQKQEFLQLCILNAIDDIWIEEVDYLQQLQFAIIGRGSAQRNPVFEYSEEAYKSFHNMEDSIKIKMMRNIFLGTPEYDRNKQLNIVFP